MNKSVYTWDGNAINDGTNYVSWLPFGAPIFSKGNPRYSATQSNNYPDLTGVTLAGGTIELYIELKGTFATQQETVKAWFDLKGGTKRLVIKDTADLVSTDRQWYIDCRVTDFVRDEGFVFVAKLATVGEPIWKTVSQEQEATWSATDSGVTQSFTKDVGNLDCYPLYEITPTAGKLGGQKYQRFITTYNYTQKAANNWHMCLVVDTATLIAAGKMQSDGRDIRIISSDGNGNLLEVPFWIPTSSTGVINTTDTNIWISPDYAARSIGYLTGAMTTDSTSFLLDSGTVEGSFLTNLTNELVLIENEIVVVDTYSRATRVASGLVRGAKGSADAAHAAGTLVRWIPELWLTYGSTDLTAPNYNIAPFINDKPVFNLSTSTNTSWVFNNFRDTRNTNAWQFAPNSPGVSVIHYTNDHDITGVQGTNPAIEIGISLKNAKADGKWTLNVPFGFTSAVFSTVERYNVLDLGGAGFTARIYTSLPAAAITNLAASTATNTWQTTATVTHTPAASSYNLIWQVINPTASNFALTCAAEAASCTVTLDSSTTDDLLGVPFISVGSEQAIGYELACTLENVTTNESITINGFPIALNQTVRINTLNKTAAYLADGSDIFSYLSFSSVRDTWLRLTGTNTLKYIESGASGVNIVVKWQGRNN